jgi:hypothetical protein
MMLRTTGISREQSTISRNIGISPTNTVIKTSRRIKINIHLRVIGVCKPSLLEILVNGGLLVIRLREVIRESTGAAEIGCCATEVSMHDTLIILVCLVGVEHGAADRCHVWAVGRVLRVEDLGLGAKAAVGGAIAVERGYAVVARGEENGVALETELEELVALALCVGQREIGLGLAVGGTDYVCGLVDAALELA